MFLLFIHSPFLCSREKTNLIIGGFLAGSPWSSLIVTFFLFRSSNHLESLEYSTYWFPCIIKNYFSTLNHENHATSRLLYLTNFSIKLRWALFLFVKLLRWTLTSKSIHIESLFQLSNNQNLCYIPIAKSIIFCQLATIWIAISSSSL